jgi:hypothetical protein
VWNVSATRGAVVGPVARNSAGPVGLAVGGVVDAGAFVVGSGGGVVGVVDVAPESGFDAPPLDPHAAASSAIAEPVRNRRRSMYLGSLDMRARLT